MDRQALYDYVYQNGPEENEKIYMKRSKCSSSGIIFFSGLSEHFNYESL